ncbi:MAG: phosphonopyruvate decarboxylase [Candidatus Riflebacteria bacterium]|nr:phosphonopyruvate decarboxylase [Candidatus Riflebacteria bacterium]
MIDPELFFNELQNSGVDLLTGVPDSLFSNFTDYVISSTTHCKHITAANEGNALAIAAGYYLSTGKISLVYLQNSGLGNIVNPLTSLTDAEIYSIPVLLMIGWRGEPGIKDEPQHIKQGRITESQMKLLEIPYWIINSDSDYSSILKDVFSALKKADSPVALLVRKNTFSKKADQNVKPQSAHLMREEAIKQLLELSAPEDVFVSTTGKTSRELYELRKARGESNKDFLMVGSMGHTSSMACGIALGCPERRVVCLDGDGSLLMHMGSLPVIGGITPTNLVHVLLNNSAHDSVGGQPTIADKINFRSLAASCNYTHYFFADTLEGIVSSWNELQKLEGPVLLEIRVRTGSRENLGRPDKSPLENKLAFMEFIRKKNGF